MTSFRLNLGKRTLLSILIVKLPGESAKGFIPNKSLLAKAIEIQ